jgi:hypothetical protein
MKKYLVGVNIQLLRSGGMDAAVPEPVQPFLSRSSNYSLFSKLQKAGGKSFA